MIWAVALRGSAFGRAPQGDGVRFARSSDIVLQGRRARSQQSAADAGLSRRPAGRRHGGRHRDAVREKRLGPRPVAQRHLHVRALSFDDPRGAWHCTRPRARAARRARRQDVRFRARRRRRAACRHRVRSGHQCCPGHGAVRGLPGCQRRRQRGPGLTPSDGAGVCLPLRYGIRIGHHFGRHGPLRQHGALGQWHRPAAA